MNKNMISLHFICMYISNTIAGRIIKMQFKDLTKCTITMLPDRYLDRRNSLPGLITIKKIKYLTV